MNTITKDSSTLTLPSRRAKLVRKVLPKKYIIAKNKTYITMANKILSNNESLRQSIWTWLNRVLYIDTKLATVTQYTLKRRQVHLSRNNQNIADSCEHED